MSNQANRIYNFYNLSCCYNIIIPLLNLRLKCKKV